MDFWLHCVNCETLWKRESALRPCGHKVYVQFGVWQFVWSRRGADGDDNIRWMTMMTMNGGSKGQAPRRGVLLYGGCLFGPHV